RQRPLSCCHRARRGSKITHMNDEFENLRRSVRRWRLVSFALAILLVSFLAIGGTVGLMVLMQLPDQQELEVLRDHERAAREQAQAAQQRAEEALQQVDAARQQVP